MGLNIMALSDTSVYQGILELQRDLGLGLLNGAKSYASKFHKQHFISVISFTGDLPNCAVL